MNVQETISTLKFVQRAKQIKNKAIINENVSGTVKLLQEEIQRLKDELEQRLVVCKNCMINPKKSLTTIPSNFESKQSSIETQNENNIIQGCNRDEVKEFCNKIEILLNYERITNVNQYLFRKNYQILEKFLNHYRKLMIFARNTRKSRKECSMN